MTTTTFRQAPKSEQELLNNANSLTGKSLQQIALELDSAVPPDQRKAKGWVGELIEQYLGASATSLPEPDFQHLGIELKTIPIDERGKPGESTYVCTVPLNADIAATWENSIVKLKLSRVLWVPIEASKELRLGQRRVGKPFLWSPDELQENELHADWQELMDMVSMGELHRVHSRQGKYLQIRPKAADASVLTATTIDTGESGLTLPRGFYLRPVFTHMLVLKYSTP